MTDRISNPTMLRPPYRPTLEPAPRIMRTQLVALLFPAAVAVVFFGYHALALILAAVAAAIIAETCVTFIRKGRPSGAQSHSVVMALMVAFTLPAQARWYVAFIAAAAAVIVGKHFFGGLGHYIWQPALVGRLIVQIFFNTQLSATEGAVLARPQIIFGDLSTTTAQQWLRFDWFGAAPPSADAFLLPMPLDALRHFSDLQFTYHLPQLSEYLLRNFPPLDHFIIGAVPGGIGVTSALVMFLLGAFFIYRGYLNWHMPAAFLASAYASALLLPIVLDTTDTTQRIIHLPIIAESLAVGMTYANYHLVTGGILFAAFVLSTDMTSRPITLRGQIIFAAAAGLLTIILRLYSPIPIPAYTALLVMATAIPSLDRLTRPT